MIGYMYILECCDNSFYVGSTINLPDRIELHVSGGGSNYTSKRLPVKLVYYEEFSNIEYAFNREQQIKRWSHSKKQALIKNNIKELKLLAQCQNQSHSKNYHSSNSKP